MKIRVTLTVPKSVLDAQNVVNAIAAKQRTNTAPDVKHLFRQTTVGWHDPPGWGQKQTILRDSIGMEIHSSGPNSDQYALVNAGSPRHNIPLQPGFLSFQRGYTPSTRPRVLSSRAYVRFGPRYSGVMQVHHPGFEAREFDQEIAERYKDTFRDDMQDAINSAH